uniref:Ciliary microtubule inner protein 5 n=1 Tax=Callorhinchus milii TaxID=7868 RepID=V9L9J2_CALMI
MGSSGNAFRTTSAGYRLPDRPGAVSLTSFSKVASRSSPGKARELEYFDAVKQDQVWREFMHAEWRGVKRWENNWSFLKEYDDKGRPKVQKPLPEYVPVFSDKVPNSTNQTFGSRIDTHLGQALIRMDFKFQSGNRKKRLDSELVMY